MVLLQTGDRICASCGAMNGQHRLACTGDESVEVISVYTRQQAIEDGILVDCEQAPMGEMRSQVMKWPLAITATAFHRYVWPIGEELNLPPGQSLEGRFWDVVWMFRAAVKGTVTGRHISPCDLLFDFYCIVDDPALWPNENIDATAKSRPEGTRLVTLKAVSGPGDDGEPVMTFMLPDED
ncbi:MAG TPA: DUF6573 family protein [Candidatus Angelobacter sp.]|jgi:hypothetical protein|nr:DUF6573 family protein [Candidatus Angelobacter sp.]